MKTIEERRKYMRDYQRKRYAENPAARAKQIFWTLVRYYRGGQAVVRAKNRKLKKEVLTHYGLDKVP